MGAMATVMSSPGYTTVLLCAVRMAGCYLVIQSRGTR